VTAVPRAARAKGALCFGLAAAAVVGLTWRRSIGISNDGVQYVEGARQLLAGQGYATGILYFDEHYRAGTLPAPQTVWPAGTSVAIAGVAALGIEPEIAGRLVARLAYLFIPPLVFLIGVRLTGSLAAGVLCAIWQLGMAEFWMYLGAPNSELPFLAASLGAIALLPDQGGAARGWLGASTLAGVATLFRYVGVFFLLALGMVLLLDVWRSWRAQRRLLFSSFLYAAPGFLIVAAIMLRNRLIAGDLRGGNTRVVHQPVDALLVETARALADTLGGIARSYLTAGGIRAAACVVGLLGLTALALAAGRGAFRLSRTFTLQSSTHRYAAALGLTVLVYSVGIIWTSSRTMLTYGARYLLPVVPLLACLMVALALGVRTRPAGVAT
jgi:hypothetical protein